MKNENLEDQLPSWCFGVVQAQEESWADFDNLECFVVLFDTFPAISFLRWPRFIVFTKLAPLAILEKNKFDQEEELRPPEKRTGVLGPYLNEYNKASQGVEIRSALFWGVK